MKRIPVRSIVLAVAVAAFATGCPEKPKEWTKTPEGFVKVEDDGFEYKAVAPDGSTIAVRQRHNDEKGTLDFWTEVFELEMVDGKGYRAAGKSDLTSGDGVPGRLLQFEYAAGDIPYHYGIALYVDGDKKIVTLETATELAELPRYQNAFDAVRGTLVVR